MTRSYLHKYGSSEIFSFHVRFFFIHNRGSYTSEQPCVSFLVQKAGNKLDEVYCQKDKRQAIRMNQTKVKGIENRYTRNKKYELMARIMHGR